MKEKIGICLSGGGARGIAHIGVLKALEEEKIFPNYVSGSSAGSIVGALYAAGISADKMLEIVKETNLFNVFKLTIGLGFMDLSQLKKILSDYIPEDDFASLERKLFICVTNLYLGKWEIKQEGKIFDWVEASCAIPLIFKPKEINDQLYGDGGVLNNLPVEPLRVFCDTIIGVSVIPVNTVTNIGGILGIAERSIDLVINANMDKQVDDCDVFLEVGGVDKYGMFDFKQAEAIYELGYKAAKNNMEEIKKVVGA